MIPNKHLALDEERPDEHGKILLFLEKEGCKKKKKNFVYNSFVLLLVAFVIASTYSKTTEKDFLENFSTNTSISAKREDGSYEYDGSEMELYPSRKVPRSRQMKAKKAKKAKATKKADKPKKKGTKSAKKKGKDSSDDDGDDDGDDDNDGQDDGQDDGDDNGQTDGQDDGDGDDDGDDDGQGKDDETPWCSSKDDSKFNICIDPSFTSSGWESGLEAAKLRWEEIITGNLNEVPKSELTIDQFNEFLGPNVPNTIDDLYIHIREIPIDGPGKILGGAMPLYLRGFDVSGSSPHLPVTAYMQVDTSDVSTIMKDGQWVNFLLHEMGHDLGFGGSYWRYKFTTETHHQSGDYTYIGTNACAKWAALTSGKCGDCPPVEAEGGEGTAGSHWNEGNFYDGTIDGPDGVALDHELMTGWMEEPGIDQPISIVTIGSLEDLGYKVDYSKADPYIPPTCGVGRRGLRPSNSAHTKSSHGRATISDAARNEAIAYGKTLLGDSNVPICADVMVMDEGRIYSVSVCPDKKLDGVDDERTYSSSDVIEV